MEKAPDAFRTISEVAEELDLPQHVLRFWETRFPQIKPLKRGGGRRYYRPDDVYLLRGIRRLLYSEGYTIKGVQRILRDLGFRHVAVLGRDGTATVSTEAPDRGPGEPPPPEGPHLYAPPAERASRHAPPETGQGDEPSSSFDDAIDAEDDFQEDDFADEEEAPRPSSEPHSGSDIRIHPGSRPVPIEPPGDRVRDTAAHSPEPAFARQDDRTGVEPPPPPVVPSFARSERHERPAPPPAPALPLARSTPALSEEAVRKLRAALLELAECKRLLDKER